MFGGTTTGAPGSSPADLNDGGAANIDDLVQVISSWGYVGAPGGVLADANNDGFVNIDDLVTVITNWGNCP